MNHLVSVLLRHLRGNVVAYLDIAVTAQTRAMIVVTATSPLITNAPVMIDTSISATA